MNFKEEQDISEAEQKVLEQTFNLDEDNSQEMLIVLDKVEVFTYWSGRFESFLSQLIENKPYLKLIVITEE